MIFQPHFKNINDKITIFSVAAATAAIVLFSSSKLKRIILCQIERIRLVALTQRRNWNQITSSQDDDDKSTITSETKTEKNVHKITVSGIYIHPVKSIRPVSVQSTEITKLGLEGDRNLMVIRPTYSITSSYTPNAPTHRFVTQRQCPALATIDASLPIKSSTATPDEHGIFIQLSHESQKDKVFIDITPSILRSNPTRYHAGIWDDTVEVVDVGDTAAKFIQNIVKNEDDSFDDIRVVSIIPDVTTRKLDKRYVPLVARENFGTVIPQGSLQDGFPVLLTSEESLKELNKRLIEKGKDELPMSRFRPNIVVKGLKKAFDEDEWKAIQIGGKDGPIFHIVKGCPRCKQSCTDQVTGERYDEPLETLAEFRAVGKNKEDVFFGQNVVLQPTSGFYCTLSSISVGDEVKILTRGTPEWGMD